MLEVRIRRSARISPVSSIMSNLRIRTDTHGPQRPLLGSGRKGRRESFYFSGAPRLLACDHFLHVSQP